MSKPPLHTLIWSPDRDLYELSTHGQLDQCFSLDENEAWQRWLMGKTAFTFSGAAGHLNVYLEKRPRGSSYWYAYHLKAGQMTKHYLGHTARVTFLRLEDVAQRLTSTSSSALLSPGRQNTLHQEPWHEGEVLLSKLASPLFPPSLVSREHLLTQLDQARFHRLTLLSASAGWGKTTLLSMWATRAALPIAWLSLDSLDDDPVRFWLSVMASLRTCVPGVGQRSLVLLRSPQPPPLTIILQTLLNELNRLAEPTILLVDDYHLITEPTIHDALLFVLEHLPNHLHLVLASRVDPPLALARLRVRSHLLELRDADLRFQQQEASQFFTETMDLSLSEEDVAELTRRTEGWIAGLHLAALSLQHRDDRSAFVHSFTGTHRFVLDYIQEEILNQLSQQLQAFLLQVAILTRLSASLCQAVTGEGGSMVLLEQLERSNLFVVSLDEERRWYRLHDLFREVLLARLQATEPQRVPQLHQRAARWYEEQGLLREAISHALAAQEYAFAARLMEQAAESLWLSGEAPTVLVWVVSLPDTVFLTHARLVLNAILYLLNSLRMVSETTYARGRTLAEQTIERLELALTSQVASILPPGDSTLIYRRLRLLHAWLEWRMLLKQRDTERLRLLFQEVETLPLEDEEMWNFIPLSIVHWYTITLKMEKLPLIPRLLSAKQRALQTGDKLAAIRIMRLLAIAYDEQATQWHRVQQECQEALALIEQIHLTTEDASVFYFELFCACYAWNQLEEASQAVHHALRIAREWHNVDWLISGGGSLVELSLAKGDVTTAAQTLQQMEDLMTHDEERWANRATWLVISRVRMWLAQGNLAEAAHWAAQVEFPLDRWDILHLYSTLMVVHVFLFQQQYAHAVAMLSCIEKHLEQAGGAFLIEFLAISVVALHFDEKTEEAIRVAVRLFSLTQPEHSIRVYLDKGKPMQQALMMLFNQSQHQQDECLTAFQPYLSKLLTAFEQGEQEHLVSARTTSANSPGTLPMSTAPVSPLLEPLTSSEQRILRLLATGYSNQEIAQTLVISLNTVKTHLKNLYSKLQVSSRTQACALARDLRLL